MGTKYTTQSASGYNSSPPPDDGTQVASNLVTWAGVKTKLADPIKTLADAENIALVSALDLSARAISTPDTAVASDHWKTLQVTGATTITLSSAASMGAGYEVGVFNAGVGVVTVTPGAAADTINGVSASVTVSIKGTKIFRTNQALTGYNVVGGYDPQTVTATTSVVTPLVGTDTAVNLALKYNGATQFNVNNSGLFPAADNTLLVGSAASRIAQFTGPIIDTGTTGSLSLKTNNGTTQAIIAHVASAVNFLAFSGAATGTANVIFNGGADTDIPLRVATKGAGTLSLQTNDSSTQLQVLHTASASRNVTVTGSNGGNPTISTTAGSLAITPAVVAASTIQGASTIGVGAATPSASGAGISFPATQSASTDVNTLDDYEEGTWTPSVGGSATYTLQTGTYTKIGRLVFIRGDITINAIGSGSTSTISGLPFAAAVATLCPVFAASSATAIVSASGNITVSSTIIITSRTAASASEGANAIFQNGTSVSIAGCYQV